MIIVMREREGKAGGGKGPLMSDKSFTLSTSNFQTLFIFEATRVDDVRLYFNYSPTVATYWGTGGARVPYVFPLQGTMIGRADHNGPQGKGYGDDGEPMFTLDRVSGHGVAVTPIQDAREVEKKQNGIGIGEEGDPSYTVDTVSHQAVAFHMTQDPISGDISPALGTTTKGMGVQAFSFDSTASNSMKSKNPLSGCRAVDKSKTIDTAALNPQANQGGMAILTSTVRRLTPTECERLQGFPDGWTDGQADSHRYKQCGNAVAVPVVQWIIDRLI